MDYSIKKLPKSQVEITITVPESRMHEFEKKAADDISQDINVKGFRKGHVPPHILEEYVDKKYIIAHTQEIAIQKTYAEVVIKENIQVVSRPSVKIEKEEPLTYAATVAVMPELEIKDGKSIKITKKEAKVSEKELEEVFSDLKKRFTTYKETDRAAKKGDKVEVNFDGFDEKGEAVEGTSSKNHPVIIGGGSMIPGFEENIIGLKKDEEKEFKITFPKDYHKEDFQNKKMKFKIKAVRIEEAQEQELNEELVEKITGKKMKVDEFKKDVEKNVLARKEEETKQARESEYLEELLKKTTVEIPQALIDEEIEFIIDGIKEDIDKRGLEFDEFLKQSKTTIEELHKKYEKEAEKRVKTRLALRKMIEEQEVKITEKDIEDEITKIKSFYPKAEHAKIEEDLKSGDLKGQIANRLTLRKFFDKVLT